MMLLRIALRNLSRRGRKNLVVAILIAVGIGAFFIGKRGPGKLHRRHSKDLFRQLHRGSLHQRAQRAVLQPFRSGHPCHRRLRVRARSPERGGSGEAHFRPSAALRRGLRPCPLPILLEAGGARDAALGLGVIGDEYFSIFRGPRFIAGRPAGPGESGWAVITEQWAQKIAEAQGHSPVPGDKIQLSFFQNQTFNIREATIAGIISYQPESDALKSVVIMDGRILRALCGYSQISNEGAGQAAPGPAVSGSDSDIDSLFSGHIDQVVFNKVDFGVFGAREH